MKCGYDNLEDARNKLVGTYCMYNDKAFVLKQVLLVNPATDDGKYLIVGSYMMSGREINCQIDDPKFNCSDYNIGYVNRLTSAAWFYRQPMKQYKQGLRYDQIGLKCSSRQFGMVDFKASKAIGAMLENTYPTFQQAVKTLKAQEAVIVAFHRNFALTYDRVHEDFILEYKGVNIGYTSNCEEFKLLNEHGHLYESLKEAVGA